MSLSAATNAAAPAAEIARCLEIAAADARLACYDRAAGRKSSGVDTTLSLGTAPVPAVPVGVPAEPPGFGLPKPRPQAVAAEAPQSLQALVERVEEDRLGQARVLLDNGQVWSISGGDFRLSKGDKVTLKRAALGSYLMTTTSRLSYRARRVR